MQIQHGLHRKIKFQVVVFNVYYKRRNASTVTCDDAKFSYSTKSDIKNNSLYIVYLAVNYVKAIQ